MADRHIIAHKKRREKGAREMGGTILIYANWREKKRQRGRD